MNRHEQDRLLASLTDDELSALRARAGIADAAPPEDDDAERQFVRNLVAEPNSWLAETLDRLSAARPASSASVDNRAFLRQLLSHAHGGPPTEPPSTNQPT
ncbi:hypothetical protein [Mycobacterium sp. 1164985.4]|uniref:hypothetical protein n=1 Tax=Mycobacterium sp. 1164985.4 TaxID=1834069 RepID=UPI0007FCD2DC|nr:hypothetical protein [Mycobacterium sp. 1164985.4]OBK75439.1 hypothetical protein A5650_17710 [Mycobacterium sp. 1164985.4]